ncbi:hypothetical protein BDN70DRAFT_550661, partial [Pholiota conissans]
MHSNDPIFSISLHILCLLITTGKLQRECCLTSLPRKCMLMILFASGLLPLRLHSTMTDISERPTPRRSRIWSFYFILFLIVISIFFSVPLAWCFAFYSIYTAKWKTSSKALTILFFISCCEVVFTIYHCHLACCISNKPPFATGEATDIRIAFIRLLKAGLAKIPSNGGELETLLVDQPVNLVSEIPIVQLDCHDPRTIAFRHTLHTWFCNAPFSSIRRHHVEKWLYWTMYNTALPPSDQIPADRRSALNEAVVLLQMQIGWEIPEGSNDDVRPMLLTVDETNIFWRPLTFYIVVAMINWFAMKTYAVFLDVRLCQSNGIEYLIRTPSNWDSATSPRPIVFLHGLGLGVL